MTREELHTEVATLTGEIVGMVSDLSPFDHKRKAEIDREILALFDRYEAEQWHPATDQATGEPRELLVWLGPKLGMDVWVPDYKWPHVCGLRSVKPRWRELPAPPKE